MSLTQKQRKAAEATKFRADCCGVRFLETHLWLPKRVKDWPQVRVVRSGPDNPVINDFRLPFGAWPSCWICGPEKLGLEVHHIFGGAHRSDEFTNLTLLCPKCHRHVQSDPKLLPLVLLEKWNHDRMHTSWVRLCQLHGRHWDFELPEAI